MAQETDKFNASCGKHLKNCPVFRNCSPGPALFYMMLRRLQGGWGAKMKAKIVITPKKAVVDPQGKTVRNALEQMGHQGIKAVHVGKYLEIELESADKESARRQLDEACHRFLSNPVIEDYKLEIE